MVAIGNSLSDLASSNDGEDGEDEDDEEAEEGQLSKDDASGWVIGTIIKLLQKRMDRCWQKGIQIDELTQPG